MKFQPLNLPIFSMLAASAFGQLAARPSAPSDALKDLKPGVVVEEVTEDSAAGRAQIHPGDLLLSWSRGEAAGQIASPVDMALVEIEQEPRGPVRIEGLRGVARMSWTLAPDIWGIQTRPNFQDSLLEVYAEAQQCLTAGKLPEAAQRWRALSKQTDARTSAWLLARTGSALAKGHQWEEADLFFQDAVTHARGVGLETLVSTLRLWAQTFSQRGDRANAEKYYQQAIAESEKSGHESLMLALNLSGLGTTEWENGYLTKAEEYYRQALDIRQKLAPQSLAVAASLNALGVVATDRGDLVMAEQYHQQSLDIKKKLAPDSQAVANSFNNLGLIARERSNLEQAEEYYTQALHINQRLAPESLILALGFNNLGVVAEDRGDLTRAEEYQRQALEIRQKLAPGSMAVAASLNNLGEVAEDRGDLAKAEDQYRRALAIEQKLNSESLEAAVTLNNLGNIAWRRGDFATADEYLQQSLRIRQKQAPQSSVLAYNFNNLGIIARGRGDLAKAEAYYGQALDIQKKFAPEGLEAATTFNNLGDIASDRGDLAKAEAYYRRALEIRQKVAPENLDVAFNFASLGHVAWERGDLAGAEENHRRALAIREKLSPGSKEHAETLAALAEIAERKGQPNDAAVLFAQALDALEKQTTRLGGGQDIRSGFRAGFDAYYRDYIDLLVAQKQQDRAFEMLERSRARSLLEMFAEAHLDIQHGVEPQLLEQERTLQREIAVKTSRRVNLLTQEHTEDRVAAVTTEIENLVARYQEVEGRIRITSPGYAALTQPKSLTVKQVQEQLLDPNTLLLEYSVGEARSYIFAITSSSFAVYEIPKRAEIEEAARRLYQLVTVKEESHSPVPPAEVKRRRRARFHEAADSLSGMIFGPVAEVLQSKRLVIVGDGALQFVPYAVLPSPRSSKTPGKAGNNLPLAVEHEIVIVPSASVLSALRAQEASRKPAAKTIAIFADPVFSKSDERVDRSAPRPPDPGTAAAVERTKERLSRSMADVGLKGTGRFELPRLSFTRREARAIVALVPKGQALEALDFDANRSKITSRELTEYRVLHVATHGLVDSTHPELSGLVLSMVDRDGNPQDGFLGLQEIYNLNLPVDMVVLSACETGLGKEIQGEGLIGLTRGFMYAGASRVVASLWKADDAATAELMERFYKGIQQKGMRPAAALREAQVEMWKQKRTEDPFYWAAFQIQGEWR